MNSLKRLLVGGSLALISSVSLAELVTYTVEGKVSPTNAYLSQGVRVGDPVSITISYDAERQIINGGMNYYLEIPKSEYRINGTVGDFTFTGASGYPNETVTIEGYRSNYYQSESVRNYQMDIRNGFQQNFGELSLHITKDLNGSDPTAPHTALDLSEGDQTDIQLYGPFGNFAVNVTRVMSDDITNSIGEASTGHMEINLESRYDEMQGQYTADVMIRNLTGTPIPVKYEAFLQSPDGFISGFESNSGNYNLSTLAPYGQTYFSSGTPINRDWEEGEYKVILTVSEENGSKRTQRVETISK